VHVIIWVWNPLDEAEVGAAIAAPARPNRSAAPGCRGGSLGNERPFSRRSGRRPLLPVIAKGAPRDCPRPPLSPAEPFQHVLPESGPAAPFLVSWTFFSLVTVHPVFSRGFPRCPRRARAAPSWW